MRNVVAKAAESGNHNVLVTERGAPFGIRRWSSTCGRSHGREQRQ
jgi:3-deoxy-D-manno-octulosonic acid (KDO) 8-phosphate synthase